MGAKTTYSANDRHIALCVFGKRGPKMFNFELLFLHGFSSKNCEILDKAVLTPQEYNDYFFWKKNQKQMPKKIKKTCWGCLFKSRLVSKNPSRKKNFSLEKTLFEQTPPNSEKMGSKSEKQVFLLFFPSFTKEIQAKRKELESESNIFA